MAIHDSGATENGHAFIVMEYVQGTSLMDILRERNIPITQAVEIIHQVAGALTMAHELGVIHRDIKPTNILIDEWGRARVADFGLAKLIGQNWFDADALGGTGAGLGTPGYAAPEQKRSDPKVDHRTDLFSLGITLRGLISGEVSDDCDDLSDLASKGCPRFITKIITRTIQEDPSRQCLRLRVGGGIVRRPDPACSSHPNPPKTPHRDGHRNPTGGHQLASLRQGSGRVDLQPPCNVQIGNQPDSSGGYHLRVTPGTPDLAAGTRKTIAFKCGPHAAASSPEEWDAIGQALKQLGIQAPLWIQSPEAGTPLLYHPTGGTPTPAADPNTKAWSLIRYEPDQPVR